MICYDLLIILPLFRLGWCMAPGQSDPMLSEDTYINWAKSFQFVEVCYILLYIFVGCRWVSLERFERFVAVMFRPSVPYA